MRLAIALGIVATLAIGGAADRESRRPLEGAIAAQLAAGGQEIDQLPRDRAELAFDGSFDLPGVLGERKLAVTGLDLDHRPRACRDESGRVGEHSTGR